MSKVRIANPRAGCAKHTTVSQAERFVRRGEAVMIGRELTFLTEAEQQHTRRIEMQLSSERRPSDVYIRGTVWWDGDDPGGMHRPGEVIS